MLPHNCLIMKFMQSTTISLCASCTVADADILSWRLVGGRSDSEGVVEVFVGNAWGTICQHKWDIMVADRVCQKIGFKMALSAVRDSHFKFPLTGTRHVLIDEIVCGDSSNNEASCTFKPSTGVCTDSEYAGVVCTSKSSLHFLLSQFMLN